ncbi:MAG: hypothetical protein ABI216_19990 [Devosia sp.]
MIRDDWGRCDAGQPQDGRLHQLPPTACQIGELPENRHLHPTAVLGPVPLRSNDLTPNLKITLIVTTAV